MKTPTTNNIPHRFATRRPWPIAAPMGVLLSLACTATLDAQNWDQTAAGTYSWTDAGNWIGGVPDSPSASVTISTALTGNQTINVSRDITLGSLTFGTTSGTSNYTFNTGANKLIFDNGSSEATITHVATANVDVFPSGSSNIELTSGGLRIINKGSSNLNQMRAAITGTGNLTLDGNVSYNGIINNTGNLNLVRVDGNSGTSFLGAGIGANVGAININYASSGSTVSMNGNNSSFSGSVNIQVGTLRVSGSNILNASNIVNMTSSANSNLDIQQNVTIGGLSGQGTLTTATGGVTLTLGGTTNNTFEVVDFAASKAFALNVNLAPNATQTFTGGRWTATGGVTVTSGTLSLASTNTFASTSAITNLGTLLINGGTFATTVANTNIATIATSMQVTLQDGYLDLNQTGVGSITLGNTGNTSNFTMTGGHWKATIADTNSFDRIIGTTNAAFSITGGTLDLSGSSISYTATYQLLDGFGSGSVTGLAITGYDTTNWTATLDDTGLLSFSATSIPEPSSYGLLLGAGLAAVVFHSRRARKTLP